jgi:peptidoglycan/xylan/chitin deacetylase (PgdA/CDA1 family)
MLRRAVSMLLSGLLLLSPLGAAWIVDTPGVPAQPLADPTALAADVPSEVGMGRRGLSAPAVQAHPPTPVAAVRAARPAAATGGMRYTTGGRAVALTFDDGPHPVWTPLLLDRLRAARVRATFCVIGAKVWRYPALVRRIAREGHTLCNHSWDHDFGLGVRPESVIRADLVRTDQAIRRAVPSVRVRYFRQPGGRWTPAVIRVARDLGMVALHWTVDPRDWERPGAEAIGRRVLAQARPGAIILLHDGGGDRSGTVNACAYLLSPLQRRFGITVLR